MNRVMLIGKFKDKPERKRLASGVSFVHARLLVEDGAHRQVIPAVFYGKQASATKFLTQGSVVAIDGRLASSRRKDGRDVVEVVVDHMEFINGPPVNAAEEVQR